MIGIVLAGGAGSRMGADKALVPFRGRPMADWVIDALRAAGCDPVISGPTARPGTRAVPDTVDTRRGPASGLAAVFLESGADRVVVVATDQPLVRPQTLVGLMGHHGDAVTPVDGGIRQYTCAVYGRACLDVIMPELESGRSTSLRRAAASVGAKDVHPVEGETWGEDGRSWWSLDSPGDIAAAEAWTPGQPIPRRDDPQPLRPRQDGSA